VASGFINLDLATEYDRLVAVLEDIRPEAIVHFAEQRAAPYSMRNTRAKRYTVDNNVRATHNLLTALVATGIDASLGAPRTTGWPSPTCTRASCGAPRPARPAGTSG
jgi:nucleoside-diphosphate-sugar epimerase